MTTSTSPDPAEVLVLDEGTIRKALRRIAHEIIEANPDLASLVIAGIPSRGTEVARRIIAHIEEIEGVKIELGVVDIAMHRDDLPLRNRPPHVYTSHLPIDLENKTIVLTDDVFYTGRTVRAAMDAISSFGRPGKIQLAVLVDRGHRELPIRPDFVGKNLPTSRSERVMVRLREVDDQPDSVRIRKS